MVLDKLKLQLNTDLQKIYDNVRSGIPTAVFGVTQGHKTRISSLFDKFIYIAPDLITARQLALDLETLSGQSIALLPPKNDVLLSKSSINKDILRERILAFHKIYNKNSSFITTIEALMQYAPKQVDFITLKKGETYSISSLIENLVKLGYKRVDYIQGFGEFSVRGDIFDIYPINSSVGYSIDFFYDELEKIREFDVETAEKGREVDFIEVVQINDYSLEQEDFKVIEDKLTTCIKNRTILSGKEKLNNYKAEILELLKNGYNDKLCALFPIFNSVGNICDLISDYVVIYDESKLIEERANGLIKEHNERYVNLLRNGEVFDFAVSQLALPQVLFEKLNKFKVLSMQNLTTSVKFFNPLDIIRLKSSPIINYSLRPSELEQDCKDWYNLNYNVILCASEQSKLQNLVNRLTILNVPHKVIDDISKLKGICIIKEYLGKGFIEHDNKLVVIGTNEIFTIGVKTKSLKTKKYTPFLVPQTGDYVVHEKFGIGKVIGNKRISTTETTKDYLEIEYKGADRLFVPLDQLDRVTKYIGGEEPTLNRLGGEFEKIKEKVKLSIAQMSIDLKKLYKARKSKKGFVFSSDTEFTVDFDNAFEFEPTEDQIIAIQEIKADMESDKVMDRLICGDVGFGKTEVAMRACFKAYLDGKQVAVVAPTTILSQQHYETFKKRFKGFGARIEVLNRFKTSLQKSKILSQLENGEIDIIIGTHALFSKHVKFADLGLLVLDEEQRFGVEHKEKIKTFKENVDTLTLTATPIPRTLHMSLVGIRDISEINTPPSQRIPTQTYVVEQSDAIIEDAIKRELDRDGQVFILYNKVESIFDFALKIKNLVPESKILVAHGQMSERTLESKIISFYNGEYDILIATTIIENGIDLPNANTIIVIDADRLGLSTLYQLRGRVGRGNRMAYAYFTYRQQVLVEQAYKRLNALMEYSDIGSGYKIALRDLEIRGAGNVLGKEQHGHMEKIGYELYSKLLKEKLTQDDFEQECELDCKITAYIPDEYIDYPNARMDCYKRISQIKSLQDKQTLYSELQSVFGAIPSQVNNLIEIAYLKVLCKQVGVVKALVSLEGARLDFSCLDCLKDGKIISKVNENSCFVSLSIQDKPSIIFNKKVSSAEERLMQVINFLK